MDEENKMENKNPAFESLDILISRWKDGTFGEIIDDWKWIFSYSAPLQGSDYLLYYSWDFQHLHGTGEQCCQQVSDRYHHRL